MSAERRYGQVPSTGGSVLSELIDDSHDDTQDRPRHASPQQDEQPTARGEVPTPTPPAPTPPRDKRTVYLSAEITPHYDAAVHELHSAYRVHRGAVQDALVAVALRHREEVEAILSGDG